MLDSLSGLLHESLYSTGFPTFTYQSSVEVSQVIMPPKKTTKSFFYGFSNAKLSSNKTAADGREVLGEGG